MIAYHFPPVTGSSGVQRALKFSRYLPEYGWEPLMLTVHPRAYAQIGPGQIDEVPSDLVVHRAFALDTARHLSVGSLYPRWLALPDRWVSWWLGAVPVALRLVRRYRPDVLWSTFPIATAHLIALSLARLTRLPWIADFRDSMTEEGYPTDPGQWHAYRWIERHAVASCRHAIFTTPSAVRMYAQRYPELPPQRWRQIENGYDEESFADAGLAAPQPMASRPLVLLHSGLLYPVERDPSALFAALAMLLRDGRIGPGDLQVVLRATGHDEHLRRLIDAHGVSTLVRLEPALGYRVALAEMLQADGLLVLQASNCNHQIPAKLYEYLRARRPILALTDSAGDTAAVLRAAQTGTILPLDRAEAIAPGILEFLVRLKRGAERVVPENAVAQYTRRARTAELAAILDEVLDSTVASRAPQSR